MTPPINDFIQKNIICWEFISKLGLFHLGVIAYEMPTLFSLQVFNSAYVLFLICRQKLKIIVLQTTLMLIIQYNFYETLLQFTSYTERLKTGNNVFGGGGGLPDQKVPSTLSKSQNFSYSQLLASLQVGLGSIA